MIAFGLRYSQTAVEDGSYAYRLEPPLTDLLPSFSYAARSASDTDPPFKGVAANIDKTAAVGSDACAVASHRELPAAAKQLLSTELQRELMRRHLDTAAGGAPHGVSGSPSGNGAFSSPKPAAQTMIKPVPKPLEPKAFAHDVKAAEKRDMFGRLITPSKGVKRSSSALARDAVDALPFRYKYHEGVTDAVRRVVRVRDLL